jgi:hypothetical protein
MQKKHFLIALALGAITLVQVGCTTYDFTSRSNKVNALDIDSNKQFADIEVNYQKNVTATSDFQKFPNQARQQAVFQCIMNNDIDVLVDPIFQVEHRPVTGYRATVSGFAGYYKVGKDGLDQIVEKKYSKETIEKYLLLTNPDFYQYYYQKSSDGNVYNIKCETKVSDKQTFLKQSQPKKKDKADKKKRKAKKEGNLFSRMLNPQQ